MIDVFIRTNTPIADIPKALSGLDCNCVSVRNGGPTQVWQRASDGTWQRDQPGMTLYEDLHAGYIDFAAYLSDGGITRPVGDGMPLQLDCDEAKDWLAAMERHRYTLEDAIGCTVGVEHDGKVITCAAAHFPLSRFKSITNATHPPTGLERKILTWVDQALAAGADEISVSVSIARQP